MNASNQKYLCFAALFGLLSVAFGAFGAHALKASLSAYELAIYDTAVKYQMFHALVLFCTVLLSAQLKDSPFLSRLRLAQRAFVLGITVFSGSLYCLSLSGLGWFGAITPLGGLALMLGWVCILWFAFSVKAISDNDTALPEAKVE